MTASGSALAGADRPHLLLICTGVRLFREYLLASIAQRYRVHLFVAATPRWEKKYVDGATVLADTSDAGQLIAAARELHGRDPVQGVLCWDEGRVIAAAQVAEALGLPGGEPAVIRRCRDKHQTRQRMAAAGVAQPRSILVETAEQAAAAAGQLGYPVVLKPRAREASFGVVLVRDEAQLLDRFDFACSEPLSEVPSEPGVVLVEEYAEGPEISVDCAIYQGEVLPICVARKEIGYPPYFEEVGHLVDGGDPMLADPDFLSMLRAAHAALEFGNGISHVEFRLSPNGPKLIEVNARLGGDLIPYLGRQATGIDLGLAAAAVACGHRPDVTADRTRFGAIRFCYVSREMTIGSIGFDRARLPDGVDLAVVCTAPGQRHSPPPVGLVWGRIAYVTAIADSEAQARAIVAAAEAALVVTEACDSAAADPVPTGLATR